MDNAKDSPDRKVFPYDLRSILELKNGAFLETADKEFTGIIQNIRDPCTSPGKVRKLQLEISFKPDDNRETIGVSFSIKSKLAPFYDLNTMLYDNGSNVTEASSQVPGQMNLRGETAEGPARLRLIDLNALETA